MRLFALILLFCSTLHAEEPFKYRVAVAAIFKDEAPYLEEWLEYHLLLGAEHFYLYNNNSSDNFEEVLAPYIEEGTVELIDWCRDYTTYNEWGELQRLSYQDAVERSKSDVDWLAIIDPDEFLVPKVASNLDEFLQDYDAYAGVLIHWQLFGTSKLYHLPAGKLLIESLVYRVPNNYSPFKKSDKTYHGNEIRKSLVRPRYVETVINPHICRYLPGYYSVDLNKKPSSTKNQYKTIHYPLQLNHYWTRHGAAFEEKLERSKVRYNIEHTKKRAKHLNKHAKILDKSIFKFIPALKEQMAERRKG